MVNFEVDLMDCVVLACVLAAYCPYLVSRRRLRKGFGIMSRVLMLKRWRRINYPSQPNDPLLIITLHTHNAYMYCTYTLNDNLAGIEIPRIIYLT